MAQLLLCQSRAVLPRGSPGAGTRQSPSRSHLLTGEPDAGNPPVRFGGRSAATLRSYPILTSSRVARPFSDEPRLRPLPDQRTVPQSRDGDSRLYTPLRPQAAALFFASNFKPLLALAA